MIKTAEYIQFEEGFLKEAAANGCDTDFLRGYIDQADEIVDSYSQINLNKLLYGSATKNRNFCAQ